MRELEDDLQIQCLTSEQPPQNPCQRCSRRHLTCRYVPVAEDFERHSPDAASVSDSYLSVQERSTPMPTMGTQQVNPNYPPPFLGKDETYMRPSSPLFSIPNSTIPHAPHSARLLNSYLVAPAWTNAEGIPPRNYSDAMGNPVDFPSQRPFPTVSKSSHTISHLYSNGSPTLHPTPLEHRRDYTSWHMDEMGDPLRFYSHPQV
jgi:hypothetical protein